MRASGPSELGLVARPGQPYRRKPREPEPAATTSPDAPDRASADSLALSTRIFVRGLMVEAECGVYAHEKGSRRPLVVDLEATIDPAVRPAHDQLAETIDYDALVAHVRDIAAGAHLHLIETFAEQVCARILEDRRILSVRMRVEKPGAVPGAACSGVEVERGWRARRPD
jgi:7,8-dihydroneopterin aldolase/epimerase/oxygenase